MGLVKISAYLTPGKADNYKVVRYQKSPLLESNCLIFIKYILSPGGGDKKAITMGGEVILEYQLSFVQELSSE